MHISVNDFLNNPLLPDLPNTSAFIPKSLQSFLYNLTYIKIEAPAFYAFQWCMPWELIDGGSICFVKLLSERLDSVKQGLPTHTDDVEICSQERLTY